MGVSQKEIAESLNLSVATVSRSLKRDARISPETRAKVATCASKLGYRMKKPLNRDFTISSAAYHNQRVIAAIIQTGDKNLASTPIAYQVVAGMSQAAHRHGATLILHTVPLDKRNAIHLPENQPAALRDGKLDGAAFVYRFEEKSVLVFAQKVPSVSVAHYHPESSIGYVGVDNADGVEKIVERLLDLGHSKLAFLTLNYNATFCDERLAGFFIGHLRRGMAFDDEMIVRCAEDVDDATFGRITKALNAGCTALVCVSDALAFNVGKRLLKEGYEIPEDVSLTGFDGIPSPEGFHKLTTVEVNFEDIGREAVEKLLAKIENPAAAEVKSLLPCGVKIGETTAEPRPIFTAKRLKHKEFTKER